MPVTLYPSTVAPEPYVYSQNRTTSAETLLKTPLQKGIPASCKEIFQSSFLPEELQARRIHPSANSLVWAAINAYNHHSHLVIRPDDVWITILTQFSIYVNKHAEELRSQFVAHEDKKFLEIVSGGNRYTVDFGAFAVQFGNLLEQNVVDPELKDWMIPQFSTTENNDRIVASMIMMATLQKYFDYGITLLCGLPSVTLQGEKSDWEALLSKLDKFEEFGEEPRAWSNLLRPILSRFVRSFDSPDSEEVKDFWQKIAHHEAGGSGPSYFSGWITAFCYWNSDAEIQYKFGRRGWSEREDLVMDGQRYGGIETGHVTAGYSYVPVKLNDNGKLFDTLMVAGMVAIEARPTIERDEKWEEANKELTIAGRDYEGPPCSVVQPVAGWWMFDAGPEEERFTRRGFR